MQSFAQPWQGQIPAVDPGVSVAFLPCAGDMLGDRRFAVIRSTSEQPCREGAGGHVITLRCLRDGDGGTVVEVADNGPGIPQEVQDKIFEDFFSTKGSEGTGLGLLVAQKVVEEHGGTITFDSEEGKGTTFRAVIPADAERPDLAAAAE